MQRFIVLGDIHIGDYPRYNNVANRLNQFNILADRLCQLEADSVIIAGDLLLSCMMKPRVMHAVKRFIEKLCNKFDKVYYILGNHDVDFKLKRSVGSNGDDTLVTLLDPISNFIYMNDKSVEIEGVNIYFKDWVRSDEVPLDTECDIFISHINLMPGFGQKVDNSKFKLGIFGDYHSRITVGNMMTTGTPIQHRLSDPIEPMVLELTLDNGQFFTNWIPLETEEVKFIKMYHDDDYPSNPTPYDILVKTRKCKGDQEPLDEKVQFELSTEVSKIIEEYGLTKEHESVIKLHGDIEPIDMEFHLDKLWVFNLRSIHNFSYEFDQDKKVIFLTGANGSGKSTFITALICALFGDAHLMDKVTKGESWNEVGVVLTYQGRTHEIQRGNRLLRYKIDGVNQDANNMKGVQALIDSNLPFLPYLWDFIVNSHTTFFSKCDRLGLFTRLFELDRYSLYSDSANEIKNGLYSELSQIDAKISDLNSKLQVYKSQISETENELGDKPSVTDLSYYETQIKSLKDASVNLKVTESSYNDALRNLSQMGEVDVKSVTENLSNLKHKKDELNNVLSNIQLYSQAKSTYDTLKSIASKGTKYKCEQCGHEGIQYESSDELKSKSTEAEAKMNQYKSLIRGTNYDEIKAKIAEVESGITQCNTLLQKDGFIKLAKERCEKLHSDLNALVIKYTSVDSVDSQLKVLECDLDKLRKYLTTKSRLDSLTKSSDECISEKSELEIKRSEISAKLVSYEKYVSLFDIYNLDSIPNRILKSITSSISDDVMEFTTEKELKSGKTKFKVSCTMNVDGTWIDFDELSDGQQAYISLKILSKLTNCLPKLGLIILDEPLKHVDEANINTCIDSLKTTNCNTLLISSHSPSYNYADEILQFELVDGESVITKETL